MKKSTMYAINEATLTDVVNFANQRINAKKPYNDRTANISLWDLKNLFSWIDATDYFEALADILAKFYTVRIVRHTNGNKVIVVNW